MNGDQNFCIGARFNVRVIMAAYVIFFLLCQSSGCDQESETAFKSGQAQDIAIDKVGPLKISAKQCRQIDDGVVATDGIVIGANEGLKIGSIAGKIFYDHDRDGELSELDGIILSIDDRTESLQSETIFGLGEVHSGPGIGPLWIDCTVELVRGDEKETVHINTDLSPVFDIQNK